MEVFSAVSLCSACIPFFAVSLLLKYLLPYVEFVFFFNILVNDIMEII